MGNQLGSVKELDDEDDLTIPYEPEEPAEVEKMTPDHELAVGISFELTEEEDCVEDGSMDEFICLLCSIHTFFFVLNSCNEKKRLLSIA